MHDVVLKETAVVRVENVRVGSGNYWEREYELPDGTTATGMSARLSMDGAVRVVGVGSEITVNGHRYCVVAIDKPPRARGLVYLRRMP